MERKTKGLTRRRFGTLGLAALAMPAVVPSYARAQAHTTLRLHHFAPAGTAPHYGYLVPWAERLADLSDGALQIELYPLMQLGGAPRGLYDSVRAGSVDMVWTLPGYSPGRFPKTEVFDLPFMGYSVVPTSQALHDYVTEHAADEYADTHLLTLFATTPGSFHSRVPITGTDSLRNLRVRTPTRPLAEFVQNGGAQAISVPNSEIPESLQRGVLDSVMMPFDNIHAMRAHELVGHHTIFSNAVGEQVYANPMMLTMNKQRYEGLPDDLRQLIDENSGPSELPALAEEWERYHDSVVAELEESDSNTVVRIDQDQDTAWRDLAQPLVDAWIEGMGDEGAMLYEAAREALVRRATEYTTG